MKILFLRNDDATSRHGHASTNGNAANGHDAHTAASADKWRRDVSCRVIKLVLHSLLRPTASISSINIILGDLVLAYLNKSLTLLAPTPTNISTKSDPDT